MFKTPGNNGFQMVFANGWTASVQWGYGNYCDNRDNTAAQKRTKMHNNCPSKNAEVAAWDSEGNWHRFRDIGDDVKGYLSSDEVVEFLAMIAAK